MNFGLGSGRLDHTSACSIHILPVAVIQCVVHFAGILLIHCGVMSFIPGGILGFDSLSLFTSFERADSENISPSHTYFQVWSPLLKFFPVEQHAVLREES